MAELPLIKAAAKGDYRAVQELLAKGHDVDECGEPLFDKELRGAKWVLNEAGADTVADMVGRTFDITPLMAVAESGSLEIADALLAAGAQVNALDSLKRSPLMTAIEWKQVVIAQRLLEAGADANAKDISGDPVLTQAIRQGLWPLAHALLDAGAKAKPRAKKDCMPISALAYATGTGVESLLLRLLDSQAKLPDTTSLKNLIGDAGAATVKRLLETHPDLVERIASDELIGVAAKKRNTPVLRSLLSSGVRPTNDADQRSPLVELIIGPARSSVDFYSLEYIDDEREIECLALLVEAGCDPNHTAGGGRSPVAWAVAFYRSGLVDWLLEHGADPNLADNGKTLLDVAREKLSDATPAYELSDNEVAEFQRLEAEARRSIALLEEHGAKKASDEVSDRGPTSNREEEPELPMTPVAGRRGLCDDSFCKAEQILIRAEIDVIADALEKDRKFERVERDVFDRLDAFDRPVGGVLALVKLKGHDWVYVAGGRPTTGDSPMKAWSKACQAQVLYAGEQSTAGVLYYWLYDRGQCVETFESDGQWFRGGVEIDPDLQDESERMHGTTFTSVLRDLKEVDWSKYESEWEFLDRFLRDQDAYLTFVWAGFERKDTKLRLTSYHEDEATAESIERVDLAIYKPTASQARAAERKPPEEDPLLQAIKAGDIHAAKAAIAAGAKVYEPPRNTSYLFTAIGHVITGYIDEEIIYVLLAAGVDPNGDGSEPSLMKMVRWASSPLATSIALKLIAAGADVNARKTSEKKNPFLPEDETPLITAAQTGKVEFVRLYLEQGADPEIRCGAGKTALDYANNWLRNVKKDQLKDVPGFTDETYVPTAQAVVDLLEAKLDERT